MSYVVDFSLQSQNSFGVKKVRLCCNYCAYLCLCVFPSCSTMLCLEAYFVIYPQLILSGVSGSLWPDQHHTIDAIYSLNVYLFLSHNRDADEVSLITPYGNEQYSAEFGRPFCFYSFQCNNNQSKCMYCLAFDRPCLPCLYYKWLRSPCRRASCHGVSILCQQIPFVNASKQGLFQCGARVCWFHDMYSFASNAPCLLCLGFSCLDAGINGRPSDEILDLEVARLPRHGSSVFGTGTNSRPSMLLVAYHLSLAQCERFPCILLFVVGATGHTTLFPFVHQLFSVQRDARFTKLLPCKLVIFLSVLQLLHVSLCASIPFLHKIVVFRGIFNYLCLVASGGRCFFAWPTTVSHYCYQAHCTSAFIIHSCL